MQPAEILERERWIKRLFHERRTSAGNQEENQRALVAMRQPIENRAPRCKTSFIRRRMPSHKHLPSRQIPPRLLRHDENAVNRVLRRQHARQRPGHRKRCFSKRNSHNLRVPAQINHRFAGANPQSSPGKGLLDRRADIDRRQRPVENSLRGFFAHVSITGTASSPAATRPFLSAP